MARTKRWIRENRFAAAFGALALALVVGITFVGVANATNSPSFCRAACHEMQPYHDAWAQGPHKNVSCVACHVAPGQVAQLKHKVTALGEVATHLRGDTLFPREVSAVVPNERCIACHASVAVDDVGFDHALHARRGPCVRCHADAGHKVSVASLKAAGYYSGLVGASVATSNTTAVVDGGRADLPGHVSVSCSRCHIMSTNACSSCHTPKHTPRGECGTCHAAGPKFVFTHPVNRADCESCHTRKPTHTKIAGTCADCHTQPGVAWTFSHPGSSTNCSSCHNRPAGHRAGACVTCHAIGSKWSFGHPGPGSTCTSCHNRPASHRAGACSTCHAVGPKWVFRHPGSSSSCTSCHNRPAGHRAGACSSCHRTGGSWAFKHSSSSRCASCHSAPSNHHGSSCASCHSPGKAWKSATVSHPRIPGGEHRFTSFACIKCHPGDGRGPGHFCSCHGNTTGPKDD